MRPGKVFVIGIAGGSGAGKTFIVNKISNHFNSEDICIISQDNYYLPKENQLKDFNNIENFDLPTSINVSLFSKDLKNLISGKNIIQNEYTFNNANKVPTQKIIQPARIIIVEGIFILFLKEIVEQLHLKVFLEVKDHIKLSRRIIRDKLEREYELEDVLYRYSHHVYPAYEKFIKPSKDNADIVLPNNGELTVGIEVIVAFIKDRLEKLEY